MPQQFHSQVHAPQSWKQMSPKELHGSVLRHKIKWKQFKCLLHDGWMQPHSGILFSNEKEQSTDTHYRVEELGRHWAKEKKRQMATWHAIHLYHPVEFIQVRSTLEVSRRRGTAAHRGQ